LRLGHFYGTSARFWLALQAGYDLDMAAEALGERLEREVRPYVAAGVSAGQDTEAPGI